MTYSHGIMEDTECANVNTLDSCSPSCSSSPSSSSRTSSAPAEPSGSTGLGSSDLWSSPLDGASKVGKLHAGHLGGISYGEVIRANVNRKWPTPEEKERWYAKFTMNRRKKLVKLFHRQDGLCCFCGIETWLPVAERKTQKPPEGMKLKQMATADHKIPQAHGGTDHPANLAMACSACNNERQTTPFEEFMEVRSDPKKWAARNRKLTALYQERSAERRKKSAGRLQVLVLKVAVLLYVLEKYPTSPA